MNVILFLIRLSIVRLISRGGVKEKRIKSYLVSKDLHDGKSKILKWSRDNFPHNR